MGEARVRRSATEKMLAEHRYCCFCGGSREAKTRKHMPPKAMFDNSHRPDRLVFPACIPCNEGTRTADLVASIVSRWRFGPSSAAERTDHKRLVERVKSQAPEIIAEWLKMAGNQEAARRHLNQFIPVPGPAGFASVGPETIRQLNLFAHKLTLALHYQEQGTSLPEAGCFWAFWKTKEDVAYSGIPNFLIRIMPDYGSLIQGRWDTRETFEYLSRKDSKEGTFACLARLRGGLLMGGFTVANADAFDEFPRGWTRPQTLLSEAGTDRFTKRDVE